jgi:multicomponent K+:H+ antiporter subunit E
VLALAIPLWSERLRPERARIGAWSTIVRLTLVVFFDIVASAWTVAKQILGPEDRIRPGFVWVPLTIRDPHGKASLASIITMTPGTLSVDLSPDHRHLLVHALHIDDPAGLIAEIKSRYERPLMAIFDGVNP